MAGDVGIEEAVVVVPAEAEDVAAAAVPEVAEGEGRVSHQYGPRVLVIAATTEEAEAVAAQVPEGALAAEPGEVDKDLVADLDDEGALGFTAFALRSSEEFASAKAQRPLAEESWDTKEANAPDYFDAAEATPGSDAMATGPTSARLTSHASSPKTLL